METVKTIYEIIALLAAFLFFVPAILVFCLKRLRNPFFVFFACYWFWCGLVNFILLLPILKGSQFAFFLETTFNLLDAPLMLGILYYTTNIAAVRQHLKKIMLPFSCGMLPLFALSGFHPLVESCIIGCGILLVLGYIFWILYETGKNNKTFIPASSRQFIYYALVFEYGSSVITFIYSYVVASNTTNLADVFLIYNIATVATICIAAWGLVSYKEKRLPIKALKRYIDEAEIKFL